MYFGSPCVCVCHGLQRVDRHPKATAQHKLQVTEVQVCFRAVSACKVCVTLPLRLGAGTHSDEDGAPHQPSPGPVQAQALVQGSSDGHRGKEPPATRLCCRLEACMSPSHDVTPSTAPAGSSTGPWPQDIPCAGQQGPLSTSCGACPENAW